jgi:formylglycine-generating enzyme required for sulfatase activity
MKWTLSILLISGCIVNLSAAPVDSGTGSIALGDGVSLELVRIPAGEFIMGTPLPELPRESQFAGKAMFFAGITAFALLAFRVLSAAVRLRRRPQFSLGLLLCLVFASAIAVLGQVRCVQADAALLRFKADLRCYAQANWMEKPAHRVAIKRPFYMGKFEITQAQYRAVTGGNPSFFQNSVDSERLPVENVSWDDAMQFCWELSKKTGRRFRLPTEAEWEYACRAGTRTRYYTGDTLESLAPHAWFPQGLASGGNCGTHPVGQKTPNAFGLYDMHGNVEEWCEDIIGYEKSVGKNMPTRPMQPLRGGTAVFHFLG